MRPRLPGWITGYVDIDQSRGSSGDAYFVDERARFRVYASHLRGYMHRWIVLTPWGMVRLHHILRADIGEDVHDHPFDFVSYILAGGYAETLRERDPACSGGDPWCYVCRVFSTGDVVRRRAEDLHRLVCVLPGTWTLVFAGPKRRVWGFQTPDGWVPWREYPAMRLDLEAGHVL